MQLLKFIAVAPLAGSAFAMPAPGVSPQEASPLESRGIKSCGKMTTKLGQCAFQNTVGGLVDKLNPFDKRGLGDKFRDTIHCLAEEYNSLEALQTEGEAEIDVDGDEDPAELHEVDDDEVDEVDEELAEEQTPTNRVKKFRLARKYACACGDLAYQAVMGPAGVGAAAVDALVPGPGDLICKFLDKIESDASPANPEQ